MGRSSDKTGVRFGRLLITGKNFERSGKNTYWDYVCDCGEKGATATSKLNAGQVSCGCHAREAIGNRSRTHGQTIGGVWSSTYRCYRAMISRCIYPSQVHYPDYGGRGITVCNRWMNGEGGLTGFECFLADMDEKPLGLTIDRIDNDGHYEPLNCRWATWEEQFRNTRATVVDMTTVKRIRNDRVRGMSQIELASKYGVSRGSIRSAIAA